MGPQDMERLLSFLGYGRPVTSRFLFLGEKEYTPSETEFRNCQIRASTFAVPWEDKNRALRVLAAGFTAFGDVANARHFRQALVPGPNFDWECGRPSRNSVSVWTWAAMFVTAWRDSTACVANGPWFTKWAGEYASLGALDSDVALAELYPLPMRNLTTWPTEYVEILGFADAPAYFRGMFPLGSESSRSRALQQVIAILPTSAIIVAYGRGGRRDEFWRRYDQLLLPRITSFQGSSARWHILEPKALEVGVSMHGHLIARVGFPWGRPNIHPVTQHHIPLLVEGLRALHAANDSNQIP